MKKINFIVLACMGFSLLAFIPIPAMAMSGSGTPSDPYIVMNVSDLQDVSNNLSAHYKLGQSIDASSTTTWNGGAGFDPISYFEGTLDGQNFTISDLFINRPTESGVGLFDTLGNAAAWLKNINMTGADITGKYNVGALVGYGYLGEIRNCHVAGSVSGSSSFGDIGGLVGTQKSGCKIYESSSSASVSDDASDVGGLVGHSQDDIEDSWVTGNVTVAGSNDYIGGCIGQKDGGNAARCYSTGTVSASSCDEVGGFVGVQGSSENITDCYSLSAVTGNDAVGGFVGDNRGTCETCYSTGAVTGTTNVGGFCGYTPDDPIINCFWDTTTSGQATSDGGTGHTTAYMKTEHTFTNAGWDFDDVWMSCSDGFLDGYPYLQWQGIFCWEDYDLYQVVWFQPNAIIEGTTLPNRTGEVDGIITWGANPAGITITHGELIPEEEYDFEPIIPVNPDIIKPEPETMTGDVDLEALRGHPLYPFVQILSIDGFLNERLVWLGMAWFIVILAMFLVHIGPDTHRNSKKPQHFVLTVITGLGLSIMFYTMGIFNVAIVILMAIGLVPAIIWERQPVI